MTASLYTYLLSTLNRTFPTRPPLPIRTLAFWQQLFALIHQDQLDWHTLTERPSDLDTGIVYISHERITALLEEQNLPFSDMIPMELHAIMTLTNQYVPQLYMGSYYVESEQSLELTTHGWMGEQRMAYAIDLHLLCEHFPSLTPVQAEEMAA